jgi:hypothetical protein
MQPSPNATLGAAPPPPIAVAPVPASAAPAATWELPGPAAGTPTSGEPPAELGATLDWLEAYQAIPPSDRAGRAEQVLGALHELAGVLRAEQPVLLRGGIALVYALRDRSYAQAVTETGAPRYRSEEDFLAAFAAAAGISPEPARLRRTLHAAELWLELHDQRPALPLPTSLGLLEPLGALPTAAAITVYRWHAAAAGGVAPSYAALAAWVSDDAAVRAAPDWRQEAYTQACQLQQAGTRPDCDFRRLRQDVHRLGRLLAKRRPPAAPLPSVTPTLLLWRDTPAGLQLAPAAHTPDDLLALAAIYAGKRGWRRSPAGELVFGLSAAPGLRRRQIARQVGWLTQLERKYVDLVTPRPAPAGLTPAPAAAPGGVP